MGFNINPKLIKKLVEAGVLALQEAGRWLLDRTGSQNPDDS